MGCPPPPMPRILPSPFEMARKKWNRYQAEQELDAYIEDRSFRYQLMPEGTMFIDGAFVFPPVRPARRIPPCGGSSVFSSERF